MGGRSALPTEETTRTPKEEGKIPEDRRLLEEAEAVLSGAPPSPRGGRGRAIPLWAKIAIFIATVAALLILFPPGAS
ncbi:MAG: hypothetical protein JXP34_10180 [Planctomycetes bacterium]|nr:hypothetical protein [Planctomycetota bacterium]